MAETPINTRATAVALREPGEGRSRIGVERLRSRTYRGWRQDAGHNQLHDRNRRKVKIPLEELVGREANRSRGCARPGGSDLWLDARETSGCPPQIQDPELTRYGASAEAGLGAPLAAAARSTSIRRARTDGYTVR